MINKKIHHIMYSKDGVNRHAHNWHVPLDTFMPGLAQEHMFFTHAHCTPELADYLTDNNYKVIFIRRDPRDQVVSHVYHMCKYHNDKYKLKDFNVILSNLISNLQNVYNNFIGWELQENTYTTTFEKLVGSKGGGSNLLQYQEIKHISSHCGLQLSHAEIVELQKTLYGGSWSFRKGQIGSWKKHFKPEHKKLFKQVAGQLLVDLGYQQDFN